MAKVDRFMIAPINSGLQQNTTPFMIPDDAFSTLENAYVFRGRVRKRFGSRLINTNAPVGQQQLYSRFRIAVGATDALGDFPAAADPDAQMPGTFFSVGQMFSVGTEIFTVDTSGLIITSGSGSANYNTTTGKLHIFSSHPNTTVYFYPSLPVMGLFNYEQNQLENELLLGFDTSFCYKYLGGWSRLGPASEWTGTDHSFFHACNYRGTFDYQHAIYVVNYTPADGIKYWWDAELNWHTMTPVADSKTGDVLLSGKMVVSFQKRLLVLNTIERDGISGLTNYFVNRIRWSATGSAIAVDSFDVSTGGRGGFADAPTEEAIVSCGFIKDRLIVYFERSTYEFAYTGSDSGVPFVFQRINTSLGADATFSAVPFDNALLGIGNTGIHACSGTGVSRIDQKIPNEVFAISNADYDSERTYGIRDFYTEMVYWTFSSKSSDWKWPSQVLTYNYTTGSWGINDDSITCFGYYYPQEEQTWESLNYLTWAEWNTPWGSGEQNALFKNVIAGNQQGWTFVLSPDITVNAPALQITNITPAAPFTDVALIDCLNHNLSVGDYIKITGCIGDTSLNDKIFQVAGWLSKDVFSIVDTTFSGNYLGGGVIARVSRINIETKQYNFYMDQGYNAAINKVDFYLTKTSNGKITVDYYIGSSSVSMLEDGAASNSLLGSGILESSPYTLVPMERYQDRVWHPVYTQADGECISLNIYTSDEQMLDIPSVESNFEMHAMTFYATPTASRLQ